MPRRYFLPSSRSKTAGTITVILEVNGPATIMSDLGKGLLAADNEAPLPHRAICAEHLSRNLQTRLGMPSRASFNSSIRHTPSVEKSNARTTQLQYISPQAAKLSTAASDAEDTEIHSPVVLPAAVGPCGDWLLPVRQDDRSTEARVR